jgi:hypothetical protein
VDLDPFGLEDCPDHFRDRNIVGASDRIRHRLEF